MQADSLPAKPPGKTRNIGVGSLSLLQGIFLTQESNQGLLNCRQILYQLSYQGSPILYIENPKDVTRKLLELINECSKVTGCKINTQKSLEFLYTNNEKSEREIKETIPFTTATKRIKYFLYTENYDANERHQVDSPSF